MSGSSRGGFHAASEGRSVSLGQRLDQLLDRLIHLVILKRAVGGTEFQRVRQALLARSELLSLEDVEETDALEEPSTAASDRLLHLALRHPAIDHDRKVPLHGGVLRQRREPPPRRYGCGDRGEIEYGRPSGPLQTGCLEKLRRDLPQPSECLAVRGDGESGPAGPATLMVWAALPGVNSQSPQEGLHRSLHNEIAIGRGAGRDPGIG